MTKRKDVLTIKQKDAYFAIQYFIKEYGYSPTYRELAKMLNCDVSTAFSKVLQLEKKGYVKTGQGLFRTIRIIKEIVD